MQPQTHFTEDAIQVLGDNADWSRATQLLRNGLKIQTLVCILFYASQQCLKVPNQPPKMEEGKRASWGSEGIWQEMNFSEASNPSVQLELSPTTLPTSLPSFLVDSQLWHLLSRWPWQATSKPVILLCIRHLSKYTEGTNTVSQTGRHGLQPHGAATDSGGLLEEVMLERRWIWWEAVLHIHEWVSKVGISFWGEAEMDLPDSESSCHRVPQWPQSPLMDRAFPVTQEETQQCLLRITCRHGVCQSK